MVSQNVMQW